MNKPIITLFSALLIAGSSTLIAQDNQRGQGGNRERPDFFALSDKDKSGSVSLKELVNARIEMMSRRGGQVQGGAQQQQRDPAQMAARIKEQLGAAFKKADADENGELSKEEFATMPQGRGARGGQGGGRGGPGGGQRGQRGGDA